MMFHINLNLAIGFSLGFVLLGYLIRWAQEGVVQLLTWRLAERKYFRGKAREDAEVDRILGGLSNSADDPPELKKPVRVKALRAFVMSTEPRDPYVLFGTVEKADMYRARHRADDPALLPRRVPGRFLELEPVPSVSEIFV